MDQETSVSVFFVGGPKHGEVMTTFKFEHYIRVADVKYPNKIHQEIWEDTVESIIETTYYEAHKIRLFGKVFPVWVYQYTTDEERNFLMFDLILNQTEKFRAHVISYV